MSVDIGIIGAMKPEVEGLVALLDSPACESVSGIDFYTGELFGKRVCITQCGIGKVFAAVSCEIMILKYSPSLIVNTGVGGALSGELLPCDTVIASSLVQHDMDTSAIGDPRGLVSGINKIYFDTDARASRLLLDAAAALGLRALSGIVATGDKFIASAADKDDLANSFSAVACEMEGCAIAQTAFINNTQFAVIRAISDSADGHSTIDYPAFLPIAVKNSTSLTLALIKEW